MKSVLLVTKTEQSISPLTALVESEGYTDVTSAFTYQQAKQAVSDNNFDLIVINTPLADGTGIDLSYYMSDHTTAGVFIIIRAETLEQFRESIGEHGVFSIPKPINRSFFHQSVKMWEVSKRRLRGLEEENMQLKLKVEEIKIVNRAKCVLMQCLTMSEAQAHRYLEKQAMDMRQSKLKIAQQVLNTYEN